MRQLEEEAYAQMCAWPGPARPFSLPLFGRIVAQWKDWKRGIPPTRAWRGRDGINPRLLMAFAALDRAEERDDARRQRQMDSAVKGPGG